MPKITRSSTRKAKQAVQLQSGPNEKRERSLRACTRCRQRKQRCDNALPHCSNCIKGGVACEAFSIDAVSRENVMQLLDQLQQSTRRSTALQQELELARLIVPDSLGLFSALVAHQVQLVTEGNGGDGDHQVSKTSMSSSLLSAASSPVASPEMTLVMLSVQPEANGQTHGNNKAKTRRGGGMPDPWTFVELLERCFPAVAPAISFMVEHLDPKVKSGRWCNLVDISRCPIKELVALLGSASDEDRNVSGGLPTERQMPVKEAASRLFTMNDMTRISATLLWALLSIVKRRNEDLLRLDNALTMFMQVWQKRAHSDASALLGVVPVRVHVDTTPFSRAYEWVHLQTATLTGKMHRHVPDQTVLDDSDAISSTTFFKAFLATCHLEHKRLEYACLHLFTSPAEAMPDRYHAECVYELLVTVKQAAERYEQSLSNYGVSIDAATNALQAQLRQKLGVQLYGLFPRMLFLCCPLSRRLRRWAEHAASLAAQAVLLHQSAWLQSGWLGDHISDALNLAELLAAFVWCCQESPTTDVQQKDWSDAIQAAIEVGGRFALKWPQCSNSLQTTLCQLRNLKEQPSSGMNSPWPSVEPQFASSQLRTSHDMEPLLAYNASTPVLAPMDLPQDWQGWAYGEGNTCANTNGDGHVCAAFPPVPLSRIDGVASYTPATTTNMAGGQSISWPQEAETLPWAAAPGAALSQTAHPQSPAPSACTTLESRISPANSTFLLYLDEQAQTQAQHHKS